MLKKFFLTACLLNGLTHPMAWAEGLDSKSLNDQGCDAWVQHDYAKAAHLFVDAYKSACQNKDQRRINTALTNLIGLMNATGHPDKAQALAQFQKSNSMSQSASANRWSQTLPTYVDSYPVYPSSSYGDPCVSADVTSV